MAMGYGSETVFETSAVEGIEVCQIDTDKYIVFYQDSGNSNYNTAVVCTVSNGTITAGTPTVVDSDTSASRGITKSDTNEAIVFNTYSLKSRVRHLSITGTTISVGDYNFSADDQRYGGISQLDTDKAIMVGSRDSNDASVVVITVSGTTISKGTAATLTTNSEGNERVCDVVALSSTKFIATYNDELNSGHMYAACGTVSGTTITLGTPIEIDDDIGDFSRIIKVDTDKAVVLTNDVVGAYRRPRVRVLTASGTTLTAGTQYNCFSTATSVVNDYSVDMANLDETNTFVVVKSAASTGGDLILQRGSVSGTTITLDDEETVRTDNIKDVGAFGDGSGDVFIAFRDEANSYYGTALVAAEVPSDYEYTGSGSLGLEDSAVTARDFEYTDSGPLQLGLIESPELVKDYLDQVDLTDFNDGEAAFNIVSEKIDSTHVAIAFRDAAHSPWDGGIVIATVDSYNRSVSYGTKYTFNAGVATYTESIKLMDSTHLAISYRSVDALYVVIATISNEDELTFGTPVQIVSDGYYSQIDRVTDTRFVVVYRDSTNSLYPTAVTGDISSGDVITYNTPKVLSENGITGTTVAMLTSTFGIVTYTYSGTTYCRVIYVNASTSNISTNDSYIYTLDNSTSNLEVIDSDHVLLSGDSNFQVATHVGTTYQLLFGDSTAVTGSYGDMKCRMTDSTSFVAVYGVSEGVLRTGTIENDDEISLDLTTNFGDLPAGYTAIQAMTDRVYFLNYGTGFGGYTPATSIINWNSTATHVEQDFFFTGSGSLTLDGAASVDIDIPVTGSGSINIEGDASVGLSDYLFSGSGEVTIDGSAETVRDFNYTGTGTLSCEGYPEYIFLYGYTKTGSGTVGLSGSAESDFEIERTGSGTLNLSSSADIDVELIVAASGGLTIGGTATTLEENFYLYEGSGTLNLSGDAEEVERNNYSKTGSGSLSLSGAAIVDIDIPVSGSGTLSLSGDASVTQDFPVESSGTLNLSGSADYEYSIERTGTGTLDLSGSAEYEYYPVFDYTGSGILNLSGNADTESPFLTDNPLNLTIGGSAETLEENFYSFQASGSLSIGGDATEIETDFYTPVVGSGTLNLSGEATLVRDFNFIASGSLIVEGDAEELNFTEFVGRGTLTLGGSATTSYQEDYDDTYPLDSLITRVYTLDSFL